MAAKEKKQYEFLKKGQPVQKITVANAVQLKYQGPFKLSFDRDTDQLGIWANEKETAFILENEKLGIFKLIPWANVPSADFLPEGE